MENSSWLPKEFCLNKEGLAIHSLLFAGKDWQIYGTDGSENVVVARQELVKKWIDADFLDASLFTFIKFGSGSFSFFSSRKGYVLEPVEDGNAPGNKDDALAFAYALRNSRGLSGDASFHDAIYVEQYSRLLPTWTLTSAVTDDIVLGTWISGGVIISTDSFRRLSALAGWMSSTDLREVISAAGFHASDNSGTLVKQKPIPLNQDNRKTENRGTIHSKEKSTPSGKDNKPRVLLLPGRPQLEMFFNEHIIDIIFNAEKYQALGIEFPAAMVLHGPPGCGKTYAVERLIEFIDWPYFPIDSNSVGSPYIHATSKKISEVFDMAIDAAPSVVVIDEMESFLSDRRSSGTSSTHHVEEVAEFLRRIPEAIKSKVLVIAMTNMIDLIDPAILRRGRFDHVIEVGMPSKAEVEALLKNLLEDVPHADDLNLDAALDVLSGKALSDSSFVIREAARLAAKSGKTCIDQECLDKAVKGLPQSNERKSRPIGFRSDT